MTALEFKLDQYRFRQQTARETGWSQWVDATLSSDPHSMETKAKSADRVRSAGTLPWLGLATSAKQIDPSG